MKKIFSLALLFLSAFSVQLHSQNADLQNQLNAIKRRAETNFSSRNYHEAIGAWRELLRESPNSSEAYLGLARAYTRLESYSEALASVDKALLLKRNDLDASLLKVHILIGLSRYSDANQFLNQLSQQSTDYHIDIAKAELAAIEGDIAISIKHLEAVRAFMPNDLKLLLLSILVYEEADELTKAEAYLKQALNEHHSTIAVHDLAVEYYMRKKRYLNVQEEVATIRRLEADSERLRIIEVKASFLAGDTELSAKQARKLTRLYPRNPQGWYLLGISEARNQNYNEALDALETASRIFPEDAVPQIVAEMILLNDYQGPRRYHRHYAEMHLAKAEALQKNFMYDSALQEIRMAIQLNPLEKKSWMAFAQMFRDRKDFGKYLDKLYAWRDYGPKGNETARKELKEEIAMYQASLPQSVALDWGIDQYSYTNKAYPLRFFVVENSQLSHVGMLPALGSYLVNLLQWYEQPYVTGKPLVLADTLAYQKQSRTGQGYDLLLQLSEQEDKFHVKLGLYAGKTGLLVKQIAVGDISKDHLTKAIRRIADSIQQIFAKQAQFLAGKAQLGVISMGHLDGASPGQKWTLFKKASLKPSIHPPYFDYTKDDILGQITITRSDERISEGNLELKSIRHKVRKGDIAVLLDATEDQDNQASQAKQAQSLRSPNKKLQAMLLRLF